MQNDNPLISIITATYNSSKTIERCIQSVLNQNYYNIEFIIIDGNSVDETINIIKKYSDKVAYWISEPDTGIYNAWNKGLKHASGDYIAFLGSDDFYVPNAIQNYVDYINQNSDKEFDFISSRISMIDSQSKVTATYGQSWKWEKFKRYMNTLHVGMFHNKSLFEKYGVFDESYKISGDYELLLRAGQKLVTGFIDKVTVYMSEGGISTRDLKGFHELTKAKINTAGRNVLICLFEKWLVIFAHIIKSVK